MEGNRKSTLRQQLEHSLQGRVCFIGVGNPGYGDDAFGVHLAQALFEAGVPDAVVAGTSPDRWIGTALQRDFDHIVFLDAVEFGAAAGSVVFLDSEEIAQRHPQISTHKISLGTLAKVVESNGATRAWLLGVQPESLKEGRAITPAVRKSMEALLQLLLQRSRQVVTAC